MKKNKPHLLGSSTTIVHRNRILLGFFFLSFTLEDTLEQEQGKLAEITRVLLLLHQYSCSSPGVVAVAARGAPVDLSV